MTSYSILDQGMGINRSVRTEEFLQLLSMIPDEHKETARQWWANKPVIDEALSDIELVMLSCFIKNGAHIEIRDGVMTWSKSSVLIATYPNVIEDLITRGIAGYSSNKRVIRLEAKAALYCCLNCDHTGRDRFNMQCLKCMGLGVIRKPLTR